MAKIKNMGTATMRFGEGIIVSGSANSNEALIVTGSAIIAGNLHISGTNQEGLRIAKGDGDYRQIVFENDGVDAASFTLSNAENLVIMNETAGKDIQFWVDPASAGDLQAMTIKEDGKVGIGTSNPVAILEIVNDNLAKATLQLTSTEDSSSASPIFELKRNRRRHFYRQYLKSDAWKRKRYVVLKRDNWTCQECGVPATQVHHKKYAKYQIGKEPIKWLVSLCGECHKKSINFSYSLINLNTLQCVEFHLPYTRRL